MPKPRNIIQIDEEKCTGCGQCILDCAEGALALVDGKAKLVGEIYCDGLGACLSGCPTGALEVIQREAEDFDEKAVEALLRSQGRPLPPPQGGHGHAAPAAAIAPAPQTAPAMACGCPGSAAMALKPSAAPGAASASTQASTLGHWPIKLTLVSPQAPFIKNADLVLLADCTAAALPDLHARLLPGKAVVMACPKLDDAQAHIKKLAAILAEACPASLTVAIMEVPCCKGLEFIAHKAEELAGSRTPIQTMVISRDGRVLQCAPSPASALA